MSKKKYVIEPAFEDMSIQKIMQLGLDDNGRITNWTDSIEDVEELNSDYINENFGELQDEAYQAGLKDAWEAAQKIMDMPDPPYWDVFCEYKDELFKKLSASEAIAKLKAYEDKRSDRIEVGDEVVTRGLIPGNTFLVTKVTESSVYGISNDGSWNFYNKESVTKTGKHYDIASILEAMRTHD